MTTQSQAEYSLIDHIERYLGPIQRGWDLTPEGTKMEPQIIECAEGMIQDARTICTLGLGHHKLSPNALNGQPIRQELLIITPTSFSGRTVPAVLYQLAGEVISKHRAFLCGDIIERNNPIFAEKPFYAFWATSPSLLPDDFGDYVGKDGIQIVFVWMVPITRAEAAFARKNGWTKLEDLFIAENIDLVDLNRKSAV